MARRRLLKEVIDQLVKIRESLSPSAEPFFRYLRDSEGDANAKGNYTNTEFFFEADRPTEVSRLIFSIVDEPEMQSAEYGNLSGALKNGWSLYLNDEDLTDGQPIKTNADIAKLCYDVDIKTWGKGDELLTARWSFFRSGSPLKLKAGDRLSVILRDDFSRLSGHYFHIQGTQ